MLRRQNENENKNKRNTEINIELNMRVNTNARTIAENDRRIDDMRSPLDELDRERKRFFPWVLTCVCDFLAHSHTTKDRTFSRFFLIR